MEWLVIIGAAIGAIVLVGLLAFLLIRNAMRANAPAPETAEEIGEVLKRVQKIELVTKGLVKETIGGEYQSSFKGQGIDFDDFREYQMGDEVRSIDWNVTARMGAPFIKKFVEERELTVFLAVDVSASGRYGSHDRSKREVAAEVAALFAFSAIQNQDKVGLILFSDEIEFYLPANKGTTHTLRIIREILNCRPTGRGTNPEKALNALVDSLGRRALVILISDFQCAGLEKPLRIASVKHDIVAIQISDPCELDLPSVGKVCLEDPETGQQVVVNTSKREVREKHQQLTESWQEQTDHLFKTLSIDKIDVRTGENYIPALHAFFKQRGRRAA